LSERHGFTVLLSVPNDAFWALENPHHQTSWGEGSFEELRTLLPADHVMLRQLVLQGSAVGRADSEPELGSATVELDPEGVPSHMLAAFGPESDKVAVGAEVAQTVMEEQRRWERQREADLGMLAALADKYGAEIKSMSQELKDYRAYIHDL